jgi:hypothetical protein
MPERRSSTTGFGYWPSSHDAEVLKFLLNLRGSGSVGNSHAGDDKANRREWVLRAGSGLLSWPRRSRWLFIAAVPSINSPKMSPFAISTS